MIGSCCWSLAFRTFFFIIIIIIIIIIIFFFFFFLFFFFSFYCFTAAAYVRINYLLKILLEKVGRQKSHRTIPKSLCLDKRVFQNCVSMSLCEDNHMLEVCMCVCVCALYAWACDWIHIAEYLMYMSIGECHFFPGCIRVIVTIYYVHSGFCFTT